MNIKNLRRMKEKELLKIKKKLEFSLMGSYSVARPIIKPTKRRDVKRTIAQINTLLREDENIRTV